MLLARKANVTTISSKPCPFTTLTMCSISGSLTRGIIGLGALEVSGRRRVPSPPAMMTAFTPSNLPAFGNLTRGPRRRPGPAGPQRGEPDRHVLGGRVVAETEAGDAGHPGQNAEEVGFVPLAVRGQ